GPVVRDHDALFPRHVGESAVDWGRRLRHDSSVIIVETIFRHLSETPEQRNRPIIDRIADAAHGVERPMLYSTIIIVCAVLPLFTLTGPAGALFGPMALTYSFSILGALLVAITLAPVLCSFLLGGELREHDTFVDRVMKWLYGHALDTAVRHRLITVTLSAGLIVATLALVPQ